VERRVRKRVLAFARWVRWHGEPVSCAAEMLGMKTATLSSWEREWRLDRLPAPERGRPEARLSPDAYELLVSLFALVGPPLSLATLKHYLPLESPAALEAARRRLKRLCVREDRVNLMTLRWNRPGAVWAMDFFYATLPIDGLFKYVLVVRDLASGYQLLTLPTRDREASTVVAALRFLFAAYGPPLVLKSDIEFDADLTAELLHRHGVFHLLSPEVWPRYNGAIEAGIGYLKTHIFYEAARYDRPTHWTCNDVEAGRLRTNELSRPLGPLGPSPDQRWDGRVPIQEEERAAFRAAVQKREADARQRLGFLPGIELTRRDRRAVRRLALALALVDQGFLQVRRRRFTPPFRLRFS
jgi:hypothetical protein